MPCTWRFSISFQNTFHACLISDIIPQRARWLRRWAIASLLQFCSIEIRLHRLVEICQFSMYFIIQVNARTHNLWITNSCFKRYQLRRGLILANTGFHGRLYLPQTESTWSWFKLRHCSPPVDSGNVHTLHTFYNMVTSATESHFNTINQQII